MRDGIATAEILREKHDVPAVFLTAYADHETLARAKATNPYGYLVKPVAPAALQSAVEIAISKHDAEVLPLRDASSRLPLANPAEQVLREGKPVRLSSAVLVPANGEESVVADGAAPILDDSGAIMRSAPRSFPTGAGRRWSTTSASARRPRRSAAAGRSESTQSSPSPSMPSSRSARISGS
jgi:hypothetical protein